MDFGYCENISAGCWLGKRESGGGFWGDFCRFLGFLGVWAGFGRGLDHLFVRTAGTGRGKKTAIVKIPITPIRLVGVYMRVCKNIEP